MNTLPLEKRVRIVAGLVEGGSLRSLSRMVGVSINTLTKFVAYIGEVCEAFHDAHVRGVRAERVQTDEIWAFCYAKEKNLPAHMRGMEAVG